MQNADRYLEDAQALFLPSLFVKHKAMTRVTLFNFEYLLPEGTEQIVRSQRSESLLFGGAIGFLSTPSFMI